jgi:hypothetical protein
VAPSLLTPTAVAILDVERKLVDAQSAGNRAEFDRLLAVLRSAVRTSAAS